MHSQFPLNLHLLRDIHYYWLCMQAFRGYKQLNAKYSLECGADRILASGGIAFLRIELEFNIFETQKCESA